MSVSGGLAHAPTDAVDLRTINTTNVQIVNHGTGAVLTGNYTIAYRMLSFGADPALAAGTQYDVFAVPLHGLAVSVVPVHPPPRYFLTSFRSRTWPAFPAAARES